MMSLRTKSFRLCRPSLAAYIPRKDAVRRRQRALVIRRQQIPSRLRTLQVTQSASIDLSSIAALIEDALNQESPWKEEG